MKTDERLNTLCEEFANLEEAEKDYILEVSQALARSVFEKGAAPLPIAGTYRTDKKPEYISRVTSGF